MSDDHPPAGAMPLREFLYLPAAAALTEAWIGAAGGQDSSRAAGVKLHYMLRLGFLSEQIVAWGKDPEKGFGIERIPAECWLGMIIDRATLSDVFVAKTATNGAHACLTPSKRWADVVVAPLSGVSAEEACRGWLRRLVAAGAPTKPKVCRTGGADTVATSYWGEAQSRFSVSRRAFEATWAETTRGRANWTKPGRRSR